VFSADIFPPRSLADDEPVKSPEWHKKTLQEIERRLQGFEKICSNLRSVDFFNICTV